MVHLPAAAAPVFCAEQHSSSHLADLGFGDLRHVQAEGVPQVL